MPTEPLDLILNIDDPDVLAWLAEFDEANQPAKAATALRIGATHRSATCHRRSSIGDWSSDSFKLPRPSFQVSGETGRLQANRLTGHICDVNARGGRGA